ncbi:MAG: AI-2E family transporter, partial [Caldilineaceae bacterium]|nr:AI-2E family transporter [Caldilineaceae bacterium]
MKRIMLSILVTLTTLAIILILWELRSIVLLFVVSLAIAAALHAPIKQLRQFHLPRALAMGLAYGLTLLGLVGLIFLVSMPLSGELDGLAQESVMRYAALQEAAANPDNTAEPDWQVSLWASLPSPDELESYLPADSSATVAWGVLGITQSVVNLLTQLLLALALSVYWTADQLHFERLWLSLLPPHRRMHARNLWRTLEANIGAYLRSEVLQSVLAGILLAGGYWLMGLRYPYLLGTLVAICWFIPLLGGALGLLFVLVIGLLDGVGMLGAALLYTLVIFLVLEYYIEPKLYRRDHYSAILVILIMLALLYALGLLGLLIAPPLALIVQIFLDELILPSTRNMQRSATVKRH